MDMDQIGSFQRLCTSPRIVERLSPNNIYRDRSDRDGLSAPLVDDMTAPELAPCWCGEIPVTGDCHGSDESGEEYGYCFIECPAKDHFSGVHADTPEECRTIWNNRRASAPPAEPVLLPLPWTMPADLHEEIFAYARTPRGKMDNFNSFADWLFYKLRDRFGTPSDPSCEAMLAAAKELSEQIGDILANSRGVDGWHRNGALATWDEFDGLTDALAQLDAAIKAAQG